jgi:hypothetical protein
MPKLDARNLRGTETELVPGNGRLVPGTEISEIWVPGTEILEREVTDTPFCAYYRSEVPDEMDSKSEPASICPSLCPSDQTR